MATVDVLVFLHVSASSSTYTHTARPARHYKLMATLLYKGHPCFAAQTGTISMHVTEAIHQNIVPTALRRLPS